MDKTELVETLLNLLPNDWNMIEDNPDEGSRMFCCYGDIYQVGLGGIDTAHEADCWYIAMKKLLTEEIK